MLFNYVVLYNCDFFHTADETGNLRDVLMLVVCSTQADQSD